MGKLLVFPNITALNVPPLETAAATTLGHEASAPRRSTITRKSFLENRTAALKQFAETVTGGLAFSASTTSEEHRGTRARHEAPDVTEPQLLAAIGAIVVDEEQVDRASVENVLGAIVLDNVEIPLVEPVSIHAKSVAPSSSPSPWHLEIINVSAPRNQGLTGKGQLIGILDTGIDASHPEFGGKTVHFAEFDESGRLLTTTPRDAGEHGTHVSALAAGVNVGVAPDADLAVAAVLTIDDGRGRLSGTLVQIAVGLNWLITQPFRGNNEIPGVELVNASLGSSGYRDYLYSALKSARVAPGVLMTAAIGNGGRQGINNHGSPGNYDIVVGVGATDEDDKIGDFSDWGTVSEHGGLRKPDLCAPGVEVWSAIPQGGYAPKNGTSMASPIVCGAAALMLESDPAYSADTPRMASELLSLVKPLRAPTTTRERSGHGRLDLTNI